VTIGKTIRMLRVSRDMSQGGLARALDVNPSYLSLVEHDKRKPSLAFLRSVSRHFKVPVGFLLLWDGDEARMSAKQKKLLHDIRQNLVDYLVSESGGHKTSVWSKGR